MKKSSRFVSLLIALMLLLSAANCSFAEAEEPVKLEIGVRADALIEDYEVNYFTQIMEQANNVDLSFMIFPANADDAKTKLTMMVSSNSKLPDILVMEGLDDTTVFQYGSKGVFLPLEDYINDPSMAVNMHANIDDEMREFIVANSKSPDGHVYALTGYAPWTWNAGAYRMWVNENWLENLGLDTPTTTDELYDVLTHFVNDDPNGNGIKDEVGLVGSKDGWATDVIPFIMNAFVNANPNKSYLYVEDGTIKAAYTQDAWRAGLEYMNMLVNDGLLSPLSFTQDTNQLKALVQVEGGMAGFVPSGSYSVFSAGTALEYDEMTLLSPLTGPDGYCSVTYNPEIPVKCFYITRDCADVEKAFAIGDWFYTREASMTSRFGEKGVEWSDDPEACADWANRFEGMEGMDVVTTFYTMDPTFWGNLQNKNWTDHNPKYRDEQEMMGEGSILRANIPAEGEPLTQAPDFNPMFFANYKPHFPTEYISQLAYTEDEAEKIAVPSTDIWNYVNEMNAAFITGVIEINDAEWENFLAELDTMGLEDYLAVVQDAYDRLK